VRELQYSSVEVAPLLSEEQTGRIWIVYGSMTPNYDGAVGVYDKMGGALQHRLNLIFTTVLSYKMIGVTCSWPCLQTGRSLPVDVGNLNLSGQEPGDAGEREAVWSELLAQKLKSGTARGYYIENPDYARIGWPDLKDLFVTWLPPLW
jgi:hypothetical protein